MRDKTILKIREFNRFYLSVMELYDRGYAGSDYSMTESRVLYEIYEQGECSADAIGKRLHIDKGYLSRIVKGFEREQLLQRQRLETDARFYRISLTEKGKKLTRELIQKSNEGIERVIYSLSEEACIRLENAMDTVKTILSERN